MRAFVFFWVVLLSGCSTIPESDRFVYVGTIDRERERIDCLNDGCQRAISDDEKEDVLKFAASLDRIYGAKFGINIYYKAGNLFLISRNYTLLPPGKSGLFTGWNELNPKNAKLDHQISSRSYVVNVGES